MNAVTYLTWFAYALCLALSFLLSGMEAGVFALSRLRVRRLMRTGQASARLLHGFLENPENFLWTILVGNTLVNFIVVAWTVPLLHSWLRGQRVLFTLAFAVFVFLFYALFDLLPKMLFRAYPNRLCMAFARAFRLVHLALRPLVSLGEASSAFLLRWTGSQAFTGRLFGNREELRHVMQESAQALTSDERAMINRVLDLQNLTVREITIPMEKVVTVNAQTPAREVMALAGERGLARLPVWEMREGRQRIAGLVVLDGLLYQSDLEAARPVAEQMRPAVFLDENLRLEVAMRRMQRGGQRLAVVLGRDGNETGIVSLEDILKVIFGEVKL